MSIWSDEIVARTKKEWMDGRSAGQIASLLTQKLKRKITRGCVIGKISRLGLMGAREDASAPKGSSSKTSSRTKCNYTNLPAKKVAAAPKLRVVEVDVIGVPFLERTSKQCAWPLGEGTMDMLCCGRPQARGPYCVEHGEVAYVPVVPVAKSTMRHYAAAGGREVSPKDRYEEPQALDAIAA